MLDADVAPGRHARHRPDRHVLHDGAARPSRARPGRGRLFAVGRAGERVAAAVGHSARHDHRRGGPRRRRRHGHRRAAESSARGGRHAAAEAGKAVLCTKPLGRNAAEARRMLEAVERAGVFHGYLEDLCYTPKTLKALDSVAPGRSGKVLWVRCREDPRGPAQRLVLGPSRPAAGRSSISAATASRSPATSSARTSGPWK